MLALPCPTHLKGASGNSSLKKLKSKLSLEKNFFDNIHKPRLSLNLNNIMKKEKTKKLFFMQKSFTKFALFSLTFPFSDTFFYIFRKTFRRKCNSLKHTILSCKHKEKVLDWTKQCLLQAQINNPSLQKQSIKKCEISSSEILIQFQAFLSYLF